MAVFIQLLVYVEAYSIFMYACMIGQGSYFSNTPVLYGVKKP